MVGSTTTCLHEDYLGSIRFVSSSTGSQVFSGNYVPYGPQYGASGTPDEFLYAGKIYDGSAGLYYEGARYYDPTIGRFITQDSSPGGSLDPQSFNRYAYARDNPLKIIDPNGQDWNIFGAITSTFSAVSSAVSTAAGVVSSTMSGWASAATNTWTAMPASQRQAIITTALIVAAAAFTVVTAGAGAPTLALAISTGAASTAGSMAIGAAASAITYTALAGDKATSTGALLNAGVGLLGGGLSVAAKGLLPLATAGKMTYTSAGTFLSGQALAGIATSYTGQAIVSAEGRRPGAALSVTLIGGGFGAFGGGLDASLTSNQAIGSGLRAATISAGATALAQSAAESSAGIPSPDYIGPWQRIA